MEKRSVQGLSLRGSMYTLNRTRSLRKKLPGKPTMKASSSTSSGPESDSIAASSRITSVDVLMQELRKSIHAMFCTPGSAIATKNHYENCSQQAFRFFTTTNTITPEAFQHRVAKFGLNVSYALSLDLFGRIDQEDLGEINYMTFTRRIFLPPGHFKFDPTIVEAEANDQQPSSPSNTAKPRERPTSGLLQGFKATRPVSASQSLRPSSPASSPRKKPQTSGANQPVSPRTPSSGGGDRTPKHHIVTALRSPRALNANGIALIYEHMPLDEIENCISQKLEEKTSKGTDRFRQAFRIFTKSEGIAFAEFYHHLELLQIHLSPAKCLALFNRFDLDGNGTIELSEFTAAIFSKQEEERDIISSTGRKNDSSRGSMGHGAGHGVEGFEVEAGSTLTTDQILSRLREKLEQHTSKESDRFRQAYKIFQKSHGITPQEFNTAMGKLGLKLTDKQVHELFVLFDFDKSGDLDLNEFVQGVMLDDCPTKFWTSVKDRQRLEETRKTLYSMAVQSVQSSWTITEIEQMLRAKIEQRTSRSSDCFRQAFRIFKKVNGIKPDEFHSALETIGLTLDRAQSDILFNRFDANGSGDIDLDEFIHGVLPPDYTGSQWVAAADEMSKIAAQQKKLEAKQRPDQYMTEIEMESWSLDEIEKKIRDKIQQATSKSSDIFRQAYKIFKKTNHITIDEFRERLLTLGFRLTPAQCVGLFRRYDTNNSNDIDLQEFCMRILPPDYTGDGDYWSHSHNYHKQKQKSRLEYVKRTKNGLLMLPKFDETRRYTRGHYDTKTFSDLEKDAGSSFSTINMDNNDTTSTPAETSHPASPVVKTVSRSSTPRSSRPPSATSSSLNTSLRAVLLENNESLHSFSSSPRRDSDAVGQASPRKVRVASGQSGVERGPNVETLKYSTGMTPTSPVRPPSACRPMSPRVPAKVSSPRCPTILRGSDSGHHIAEFEEEEIIEDGQDETVSSMDLMRAKRRERRRYNEKQTRKAHQEFDEESRVSWDSSRYAESVGGASSTISAATSTNSKALGTAKYTPQRSHTLLIRRFMQATKRSGRNSSTTTSASKRR